VRHSLTGRYLPVGTGLLAMLFWAWSAVVFHAGDKDRALYLLLASMMTAAVAGASYARYRKSLGRKRR